MNNTLFTILQIEGFIFSLIFFLVVRFLIKRMNQIDKDMICVFESMNTLGKQQTKLTVSNIKTLKTVMRIHGLEDKDKDSKIVE